jgi:hypothetical protein
MIYHLDKMKLTGEALDEAEGKPSSGAYIFTKEELEETIKAIDTKLENRLYLIKYDILKEWVYVKTLVYEPSVVPHIKRLRELLVTEYNEIIVPNYNDVVSQVAQEIPT